MARATLEFRGVNTEYRILLRSKGNEFGPWTKFSEPAKLLCPDGRRYIAFGQMCCPPGLQPETIYKLTRLDTDVI